MKDQHAMRTCDTTRPSHGQTDAPCQAQGQAAALHCPASVRDRSGQRGGGAESGESRRLRNRQDLQHARRNSAAPASQARRVHQRAVKHQADHVNHRQPSQPGIMAGAVGAHLEEGDVGMEVVEEAWPDESELAGGSGVFEQVARGSNKEGPRAKSGEQGRQGRRGQPRGRGDCREHATTPSAALRQMLAPAARAAGPGKPRPPRPFARGAVRSASRARTAREYHGRLGDGLWEDMKTY